VFLGVSERVNHCIDVQSERFADIGEVVAPLTTDHDGVIAELVAVHRAPGDAEQLAELAGGDIGRDQRCGAGVDAFDLGYRC
jgi:hypothetical protein